MIHPIPAEGFTKISGKRRPPKSWGDKLWCQLRTGWVDRFGPWSVETTEWRWNWINDHEFKPSGGDVVAVRRV